jgi:hypothetical protein
VLEWEESSKPKILKNFRVIDLVVTQGSLIGSPFDSEVHESDVREECGVTLLKLSKSRSSKVLNSLEIGDLAHEFWPMVP